jgi:large subunit ribosomal protein L4|uniref:Large ribosomal subunit protein uL4c n=1 Tax=Vaucheria litorea TaxID=109269 RepID=B7T1Y3_VAULI|nr:ribosomal protein L4 [Vaucheria litorea]ACF70949.1 ribosomal protein L4 [Vaucheria litorea]
MIINKIINFPIKTLTNDNKENITTLTLNIPKHYESKINKSNYLLHRALQTQLTNERQGTSNTKTRAEVQGGGRKPWKQKGTGRARAGSNRSPLWRGGGVIFGPKIKKFSNKINRKEWRLSLRLLLLNKQKNITIINTIFLDFFKTKNIIQYILKLGIDPLQKLVIIIPNYDENLRRGTKNLKNVQLLKANCLNIKDILKAEHIFIDINSLKIIEETYNND